MKKIQSAQPILQRIKLVSFLRSKTTQSSCKPLADFWPLKRHVSSFTHAEKLSDDSRQNWLHHFVKRFKKWNTFLFSFLELDLSRIHYLALLYVWLTNFFGKWLVGIVFLLKTLLGQLFTDWSSQPWHISRVKSIKKYC